MMNDIQGNAEDVLSYMDRLLAKTSGEQAVEFLTAVSNGITERLQTLFAATESENSQQESGTAELP